MEETKTWAKKKGLGPGRVKGTKDGIQFVASGGTDRVDEVDWDFFESVLKRKRLGVYGTREGWMRIMRKKR